MNDNNMPKVKHLSQHQVLVVPIENCDAANTINKITVFLYVILYGSCFI